MAQFKAYSPDVEVNGQTVLAFVNAVATPFKKKMVGILEKHGIKDVAATEWYPQQAWLSAFEEIAGLFGEITLLAIGKAIPKSAKFPDSITDLESALKSINDAYHFNHRNGEIGHYKLTQFDAENHTAEMECDNPYPDEFDKGIILAIARKWKPKDAVRNIIVTIDNTRPTRSTGANTTYYKLNW